MSCSSPIIVNGRLCACGKCVNCKKKKINDWSLRLELERRSFKDALFITLTYNNDHLPRNALLNKRDLQLFFKRLRRKIDYYNLGYKIRYFASGEYGTQNTIRPHYHVCLFGLPLNSFIYSLILSSWNCGFIDVKSLNYKSARYVAKYCTKSMQKEKIDYETGEVVREFVMMSRRYGIGFCVLNNKEFVNEMIDNNFIRIGKYKYSIPYSFRRKLKDQPNTPRFKKTITILWNDKLYKTFNDCFVEQRDYISCIAYYLKKDLNIQKVDQYDYFRYISYFKGLKLNFSDINYVSFSDYFKKIEASQLREKEFFKFHLEKYYDYYKKLNFNPDKYLSCLKRYIYDKYYMLFY